jgi:hypothetical protein
MATYLRSIWLFSRSLSLGSFRPLGTHLPRDPADCFPAAVFPARLHYRSIAVLVPSVDKSIIHRAVAHPFRGDFPCNNLARASCRGSVKNLCGLGRTLIARGSHRPGRCPTFCFCKIFSITFSTRT